MTTANVRQKENVWKWREEEEGAIDCNMKSTQTLEVNTDRESSFNCRTNKGGNEFK